MEILKKVSEYLFIVLLAAVLAVAYEVFVFPNSFAPAGFNGIATMIQYVFNINAGYMAMLFNIPLIIAVFIWVDKEFAVKTFVYIITFSGALILLKTPAFDISEYVYQTETGTSTILGPVVAGIIGGTTLGLAFMVNCCSGGTDLLAVLSHKINPSFDMIWVMFFLNSAVAVVSYFVYDHEIEPVIMCILYSYFSSALSDKVFRGSRAAVRVEIITDTPGDISKEIIERLGHSATLVSAEGCYTKEKKGMLICVINKDEIMELKRILSNYPGSFANISNVAGTIGKFKYRRKKDSALDT